MSRIIEDMREQSSKETTINFTKKVLADGILTPEKIAEYTGLSLEEIKVLNAERTL